MVATFERGALLICLRYRLRQQLVPERTTRSVGGVLGHRECRHAERITAAGFLSCVERPLLSALLKHLFDVLLSKRRSLLLGFLAGVEHSIRALSKHAVQRLGALRPPLAGAHGAAAQDGVVEPLLAA